MNNEEKAYRKLMPNPDIESMAHDHGRGTAAIYGSLDEEYFAERKCRRIEYVMSRLTMKQHELYCLMAANLTQAQIAAEMGISQPTVCELERALVKKIKKILKTPYITPSFPDYSGETR